MNKEDLYTVFKMVTIDLQDTAFHLITAIVYIKEYYSGINVPKCKQKTSEVAIAILRMLTDDFQ